MAFIISLYAWLLPAVKPPTAPKKTNSSRPYSTCLFARQNLISHLANYFRISLDSQPKTSPCRIWSRSPQKLLKLFAGLLFMNKAGYRVGRFGRGGTDDELEKPLNPV